MIITLAAYHCNYDKIVKLDNPANKKAPFVAANGAGGFSLGVTYGFQSVKVRWVLVIQSGPMPLNSFSMLVSVRLLSVGEPAG